MTESGAESLNERRSLNAAWLREGVGQRGETRVDEVDRLVAARTETATFEDLIEWLASQRTSLGSQPLCEWGRVGPL